MTDCCNTNDHGHGHGHDDHHDHHPLAENDGNQAGRTLLAGLLGGLASAAGYIVYTRLPDEQKERLHHQVRGLIESRLNEFRSNLKL